LNPDLAARIAAGEVIERPASVVKELIENSLDAGASHVSIEIQNGGLSLIRVSDNGSGISSQEVELAFLRHATSKLQSLSDMETVTSLGFRGEALPSIAAVADVEMVTAGGGETGTHVRLKDGIVIDSQPRAHPAGTTITVERLFHTTPARLKFMKSIRAETARISYLVGRYALAFPGVRFNLLLDGRTGVRTSGTGRLRDAVASIYGAEMAAQMLDVGGEGQPLQEGATSLPSVTGLASPPQVNRASRSEVTFLVNRRWIFDPMLSRAVDEAYQGLLMVGRYPIAVLSITISPAMIDVNVHPAKKEVRFRHESLVFGAVSSALKAAVTRATVPEVKIGDPVRDLFPEKELVATSQPQASAGPTVQPALSETGSPAWAPQSHRLSSLRVLGQVDNTYIVAGSNDGLYLVDQHAAHERVLYESLKDQMSRRHVEVQGLLQPMVVEFTPTEEAILGMLDARLAELGFAMEHFGEHSYLVRTVPVVLKDADIASLLRELVAAPGADGATEWLDRALESLACHGAIRSGKALDEREAAELLRLLEATSSPRTCPHGRPTMIHLSSGELRRHFGR